jgi:RNA polymerase sigma-70 factor (ECF subfamily)
MIILPVEIDMENSDEALLRKVRQTRDKSAMESLFQRYQKKIYSFVLYMIPVEAIAEDLTLDTFMKVWEKPNLFDETKSSFSTWIYRISRNLALDFLKSRRNQHDTLDNNHLVFIDNKESPEAYTIRQIEALDLKSKLKKLDVKSQKLVYYAFFQGLSHTEISELTSMPLGSVKSILRKALRDLKSYFEANGKKNI